MKRNRIVITGIGVVSIIGTGKEAFFENLFSSKQCFNPVTLFDASKCKVKTVGEIAKFDASVFLGKKGLHDLNRSARFFLAAAQTAIDDSKIVLKKSNKRVGVSVGMVSGVLDNLYRIHSERLKFGPKLVNPSLVPNVSWNQAASKLAIRHKIMGINSTVSTGMCSGLDALDYAVDCINNGYADTVITGAVEDLSFPLLCFLNSIGVLSGSKKNEEIISCPFDIKRNGYIFSEGAVALTIEKLSSAVKRKARIYAEIKGSGSDFYPYKSFEYDPEGRAMKTAMLKALKNSKINIEDIDYICCNANSTKEADSIEAGAIREVFKNEALNIPASSVKSFLGESFGVSGMLGIVSSIASFEKNLLPATINLEHIAPGCELDHVLDVPRRRRIKTALINSFDPGGMGSSVVIEKYV